MESQAALGAEGQSAGDLVAMKGRAGRLGRLPRPEHVGGEVQVSHLSLPSWDFSEAETHSSRSLKPCPPPSKVTSKYELMIHKKGGSFQGWRCAEVSWGLDQSYQYRWEGRVITHKGLQVQIPDSPLLAA